MERLQKAIAEAGVTSRRKAEQFILAGKVKVNGKVIQELGYKVDEKDRIEVEGVPITKEKKVYFLLNKPREMISSVSDEKHRKTVVDLIPCKERIYPVGRLDYDTTGVLLLTNDGEFANILMHPSKEVEKVYIAKIKGILKGEAIKELKQGVLVDGQKVKAERVKVRKIDPKKNTSMVEISIHEGKNHQVKKMFESVGYEVLKLKRERISFFDLTGLKSGEYRPLTPKEIAKVFALKKKEKKHEK
ncbi:MAG TPA: rRNA pseudouridine synthase [Candidatus Onthousia faecigallinarum]|nr:rRNA pseudouridine synthase [Candidatus Onthousia faecigallinarum]